MSKKNTQNDTATITIQMTTDKEDWEEKKILTRRVRVKSEEEGKNVDVKKEKKKTRIHEEF